MLLFIGAGGVLQESDVGEGLLLDAVCREAISLLAADDRASEDLISVAGVTGALDGSQHAEKGARAQLYFT